MNTINEKESNNLYFYIGLITFCIFIGLIIAIAMIIKYEFWAWGPSIKKRLRVSI